MRSFLSVFSSSKSASIASPDFPNFKDSNCTDERRQKMLELTEKARATFPPEFAGQPQDEPEETPEGNRALERGRWANAHRKPAPHDSGRTGAMRSGFPSRAELENELGGIEGFFTLFGLHYVNMFNNPRMSVLFDTRDPDSAACAMEHGKRVAATFLDEWGKQSAEYGGGYFAQLGRGFDGGFAVMHTHAKAKQCPMRPRSQQQALPKGHPRANRRFTCAQRDSWVGSIMCAAEECGTSVEFQNKLGLWLAMTVSAYAPFVDEATGQLDWMEESTYGGGML